MADETTPSLSDDLREALDATLINRSQTSRTVAGETSRPSEAPAPSNASADNAPVAPVAASVTDPSPIPEQFRSEFTNVSPAAMKFLQDSLMMRSDYTKKTTNLAEKTRLLDEQLDLFRKDAMLWRRLQADKDLMKVLSDHVSSRANRGQVTESQPVQDDEEDLDYLDPVKMKAWRQKVREEAKQEALKAFDETYIAPQRRQNQLGQIMKAKFIEEMGLDPEVVAAAANLAGAHAEKFKIDVNSENVIDLVSDFLDIAKSKANKSTPPAVSTTPFKAPEAPPAQPIKRMATTTPPMSGGIAPPPAPAFKREGRAPTGRDDYHAAVLDELGKAWGQEVTETDLNSILNTALTGGQ